MSQIVILLIMLVSLLFAAIALYKSFDQPFYLKIEVQYGRK